MTADPLSDDVTVNDSTLLRRHLNGDQDAFGELVRRHRDRLWAVALRTLGDPDDAADALQDGLVNAFRRADSYRNDAAVTTWLHRIVVNACIDRVRRARARPTTPLPDQVDHTMSYAAREVDPAEQVSRRMDVDAALATLPPEQRAAVVLVHMEGIPVSEVAELLGCAVGTVKSRCARARAKLVPLLVPAPRDGNPAGSANVTSTTPRTQALFADSRYTPDGDATGGDPL